MIKRVFIVEDEIIVAKGIEDILTHNGYEVVAIATNYKMAKQKLGCTIFDIILCDINLNSEKTGIELMEEMASICNVPYIFISAYDDIETIRKTNYLTAANYITKPFNEKQILTCLHRIFEQPEQDEDILLPTDREKSILQLVGHGYSTKEIAEKLNIAFNTVETHRKNLFIKYNVKTMAELICYSTAMGWIEHKRLSIKE